jgi:hypothetical protein
MPYLGFRPPFPLHYQGKGMLLSSSWIKITRKNARGTLFEGNKKLNLVLPCDNNERGNTLILKEFLCYKLF